MRKNTFKIIFFLLLIITVLTYIYYFKNTEENTEYKVTSSDFYVVDEQKINILNTDITENEKKWLLLMREEEKLARDVYTTLGNIHGLNIFFNIAKSEQTHTDSIKILLTRYNIEDPSVNDTVGEFTSPVIQKLYNDLTDQGKSSTDQALVVGAMIEDLDIHDLDNAMSESNKSDILQVYKNLQKGSRNHMRAFVKNIEANGGLYSPQYISSELYKSIISSPQEKGKI